MFIFSWGLYSVSLLVLFWNTLYNKVNLFSNWPQKIQLSFWCMTSMFKLYFGLFGGVYMLGFIDRLLQILVCVLDATVYLSIGLQTTRISTLSSRCEPRGCSIPLNIAAKLVFTAHHNNAFPHPSTIPQQLQKD